MSLVLPLDKGYSSSLLCVQQNRPTMRAGGPGGTRRARTAVAAKAFFRFVGWSAHQAANASRWAAYQHTERLNYYASCGEVVRPSQAK